MVFKITVFYYREKRPIISVNEIYFHLIGNL